MGTIRGPVQKGLNSPPRNSKPDGPEFAVWFNQVKSAMPFVTTWQTRLAPSSFSSATSEQIFPIAGLQPSDIITVNKPSHQAGLSIGNARCSSLGNLAVTFVNNTGGAILPATETYLIVAVRL